LARGGAAAATSARLAGAASSSPPMAAESATELYYRDHWLGEPWRTPEAVMLIHGVYESSIAWYGWVPRMAQQFRVLRPDLPGSGRSPIPPGFEWALPSLTSPL